MSGDNKDWLPLIVVGVIAGFIFGMSLIEFGPLGEWKKLKAECETTIPRDQYCIIQAVKPEFGSK